MVDTLEIQVQKVKKSRISQVDPAHLSFGKEFSDHMFVMDYEGDEWINAKIIPYGNVQFSPALSALHYGQTLFEGLKAHRSDNGDVLLFRPLENLKRLNRTAERMCMPAVPEDIFMAGLVQLLKLDKEWVFANEGCSLYIRPMMFATDESLGVKASKNYRFIILTSPSGPYFMEPLRLKIETGFSRACEGGVGYAKVAGNYGASLFPTKQAQEAGYHQLLWTDSKEHKYIEESGMMNVMFVIGDTLVTPTLDSNTILVGKTRDTIIQIAKDWGMKVEEKRLLVSEVLDAIKAGNLKEAFGVGTAATVAPVAVIGFSGKDHSLPPVTDQSFSKKISRYINDYRSGRIPDKHNWLLKI